MIMWSMPPNLCYQKCNVMVHPSHSSCIRYIISLTGKTLRGGVTFFCLVEAFGALRSLLLKKDNAKKYSAWKTYLENYARFQMFCICIAPGMLSLVCLLRRIQGQFIRLTTVAIPASVFGTSIWLIDHKTRVVGTSVISNSVLSLIWKRMRLRLPLAAKTSVFMVLSSIVSSLITLTKGPSSFWFFNPTVPKFRLEQLCYHQGRCKQYILSNFARYFTTGLALSLIKSLLKIDATKFCDIQTFVKFLFPLKTFSMASFFGLYSFIYQSTRCTIYKKYGLSDTTLNAVAGWLAGISFAVNPNITILNFGIITILQIIISEGERKGMLPDWSYSTIAFALGVGFTFDAFFLGSDCPNVTRFLINSACCGEGDVIAASVKRCIA